MSTSDLANTAPVAEEKFDTSVDPVQGDLQKLGVQTAEEPVEELSDEETSPSAEQAAEDPVIKISDRGKSWSSLEQADREVRAVIDGLDKDRESITISIQPLTLQKFIETVTPSMLEKVDLLNLRRRWGSSEGYVEMIENLRRDIETIIERCKSLIAIAIEGDRPQDYLPASTICKIGRNLQYLSFVQPYRRGRDSFTVKDLKEVKEHCTDLRQLEVDLPMFPYHMPRFDRLTFEADEFLELVATLPALQYLTLCTHHSLGTECPEESESSDPDYDDADKIMKGLQERKIGAPFERIVIVLDGSYRPPNWRSAIDPDSVHKGWSPRRVFVREVDKDGSYSMTVVCGAGRVGPATPGIEIEPVDKQFDYNGWFEGERVWRPYFDTGSSVRPRARAVSPCDESETKDDKKTGEKRTEEGVERCGCCR